jgi:hypothetical protein
MERREGETSRRRAGEKSDDSATLETHRTAGRLALGAAQIPWPCEIGSRRTTRSDLVMGECAMDEIGRGVYRRGNTEYVYDCILKFRNT